MLNLVRHLTLALAFISKTLKHVQGEPPHRCRRVEGLRYRDEGTALGIEPLDQATEVDEQNFFHARETGGTVVSSALVLMEEIIRARYPRNEWNVYGAQASDGDNWHDDSPRCRQLLEHGILPLCRYFAYIQVVEQEQNLWHEYSDLAMESENFAIRKAAEVDQIYPVFRDLFKKEGAAK